jgi:O-antigen/teichoic acid export membrane protein
MKNIRRRLIKGSMWISGSHAIVNALSILSTIILARLLVPSDFGIVSLATTLLAIVSSVTELSLSLALVRHEAPTQAHFDTVWTLGALRGLFLGLLFAAAGEPAAAFYDDARLVNIMAVFGFTIFLSGLTNPRTIMLQRDLIFWQEFVLNVTQKLANFLVSLAIAYFYRTYWALVIGLLAMQVTNVVVSYTILPYRPRISFAYLKELFSFSIWLTGGRIVNTLNWRFDYLLVGRLGWTSLGHYSVGSNLAQIPTRETASPLIKVIFPGFSTIIRNESARLASAYQRAQTLLTAIALPAGIGAALIAEPLVLLAMGEKWLPVVFVIQVLAPIFALQTMGSLSEPLGMANGQTRSLFIRNVQMLLFRAPAIAIGMYYMGLKGVLIARVISGLFSIYLNMRLVHRFTGLTLQKQLIVNIRTFASIAVMVTAIVLILPYFGDQTDPASLILKITMIVVFAVILYCGTSVLLWTWMKKPPGPEQEFLQLFAKIASKFKTA